MDFAHRTRRRVLDAFWRRGNDRSFGSVDRGRIQIRSGEIREVIVKSPSEADAQWTSLTARDDVFSMRIGEETTTAVSALSTWVAFKCDLAKSAISSSNHLARLMRWGVDSLSEAGCIGRALATE